MNTFGSLILWATLISGVLSLISIIVHCIIVSNNNIYGKDIYGGDILLLTEIEHNKDCVLADAIGDEGVEIVNQIGKEDLLNAMQSGLLQ